MANYYDGITSTVLSNPSKIQVQDVIEKISKIKSEATMEWINSIDVQIENSVIFGAYITGSALAKELNKFSDVSVVDIHPHLKGLLTTGSSNLTDSSREIKFYQYSESVSELLKGADLVVDTTGLGGLKTELIKHINGKVFLVEDPCSEGSDASIQKKNMTLERIENSKSINRGILKTGGLNSKTSGTMTLAVQVLLKSLQNLLDEDGVLYGVVSMDFYEGILFHEKNIQKFQEMIKKPAVTVSSLRPVSVDTEIEANLTKIKSMVEHVSI